MNLTDLMNWHLDNANECRESEQRNEREFHLEAVKLLKNATRREPVNEALCGDHLVPVSQCDCLWGYKRARGSK